MTEQAAAEALFAAVQEDTGRADYGEAGKGHIAPVDPAPTPAAEESKPTAPAEPVAPEGESAPETTPAEQPVDPFTKLDPNTLPDELQPFYKSLQGDYTRKTQELAELRKQIEGMDAEEAKVAVDLLHSLGTPEGALSFYGLLGEQLQSLGLQQTAATTPQQQPAVEQPQAPSFDDDPEAALRFMYEQQRDELQALRSELEADRTQAAAEAQYYSLAAEISRQEALVRDSRPDYTDEDINAVYELAPAFGGDLVQAAARYDQIVSDSLARMLNQKAQARETAGVQPSGVDGYAEAPPTIRTLDQAHAAAMEQLRHIEAES